MILVVLVCACTQDIMPDQITFDMELMRHIESTVNEFYPDSEQGINHYIFPDEIDLESIPQDLEKNPLTAQKVELGKFLFFETGFATKAKNESGMGTYSCGTCHIPSAGFKSGNSQGIADGGEGYGINGEERRRHRDYIPLDLDVQNARPLSLLNVAYVKNTTWNGRFGSEGVNEGTEAYWVERDGTIENELGFEAIETQNFEGLKTHRIEMTRDLIEEFGYTSLFDEAFPELDDDLKYSNYGGSLAISAYIRTLLANEAPFQDWLKGNRSSMTLDEKKGAILFFDKANCAQCHHGPNLGSLEFHALGVKDMDDRSSFQTTEEERLDRNLGRGAFTGQTEDMHKFKVPQLYNQSDSPFFFHGASIQELDDVLEYKIQAISENDDIATTDLSKKFLPLNLTEEEKSQLLLFLEKSLRDPDLNRYMPDHIYSENCFPNNDPVSRVDLGCN